MEGATLSLDTLCVSSALLSGFLWRRDSCPRCPSCAPEQAFGLLRSSKAAYGHELASQVLPYDATIVSFPDTQGGVPLLESLLDVVDRELVMGASR
eukprot:1321356-Amphidinium_carterae.1